MNRNTIYHKIFGLLRDCKKSNEWLHEMLPLWVGKSSLKELSQMELDAIITALENVKKVKPFIENYRTEKQAKYINFLKSKLKLSTEKLNGFILHTTGDKNSVDELTLNTATAVINGLKNILLGK